MRSIRKNIIYQKVKLNNSNFTFDFQLFGLLGNWWIDWYHSLICLAMQLTRLCRKATSTSKNITRLQSKCTNYTIHHFSTGCVTDLAALLFGRDELAGKQWSLQGVCSGRPRFDVVWQTCKQTVAYLNIHQSWSSIIIWFSVSLIFRESNIWFSSSMKSKRLRWHPQKANVSLWNPGNAQAKYKYLKFVVK